MNDNEKKNLKTCQSLSSTNEMRGFFLDHLFSTKSDISVMSFEK